MSTKSCDLTWVSDKSAAGNIKTEKAGLEAIRLCYLDVESRCALRGKEDMNVLLLNNCRTGTNISK